MKRPIRMDGGPWVSQPYGAKGGEFIRIVFSAPAAYGYNDKEMESGGSIAIKLYQEPHAQNPFREIDRGIRGVFTRLLPYAHNLKRSVSKPTG